MIVTFYYFFQNENDAKQLSRIYFSSPLILNYPIILVICGKNKQRAVADPLGIEQFKK